MNGRVGACVRACVRVCVLTLPLRRYLTHRSMRHCSRSLLLSRLTHPSMHASIHARIHPCTWAPYSSMWLLSMTHPHTCLVPAIAIYPGVGQQGAITIAKTSVVTTQGTMTQPFRVLSPGPTHPPTHSPTHPPTPPRRHLLRSISCGARGCVDFPICVLQLIFWCCDQVGSLR